MISLLGITPLRLVVNGTTEGISFDPDVSSPVINTTSSASNSNLTITSSGGSVIITLGVSKEPSP